MFAIPVFFARTKRDIVCKFLAQNRQLRISYFSATKNAETKFQCHIRACGLLLNEIVFCLAVACRYQLKYETVTSGGDWGSTEM